MPIPYRIIFTLTFSLSAALVQGQETKTFQREEDIERAVKECARNNKPAEADSLIKVAIAHFPKGKYAMIAVYNKSVNVKGSSADKLKNYKQWIKDFPEPKDSADIVYDYARSGIAWAFAEENNARQHQLWTNRIKSQGYRSIVEVSHGEKFLVHKDTVTAERLIRAGVADAEASYPTSKNPMAKGDYYQALTALSSILYKERKYAEALKYADLVYNGGGNKENPAVKKTYALALAANGQADEALQLLGEIVSAGKADNDVNKHLPLIYTQAKGSDTGYTAFVQQLETAMLNAIQERLKKDIISEQAPSFTLKNLAGETVSLSALKGKTVILDFWATWCGPCKRSFPAMQKAINKYKNDPTVQFLFIDTWERIPEPGKDVQQFIDDNKYSFEVLLDDKTTGVVDQFKVNSIPAKFIIDGEGNIRFKLTGFSGGDDPAVAELSAMIEMIRKG